MARDSMQPWLDRVSFAELEVAGLSPRSALGWWDWDGTDAPLSRAHGSPVSSDSPALPATAYAEVDEDTDWGSLDFELNVASY